MISIAMATYNGERFIQEQLDSILEQSVQDFELIVCDDCSKDSTVDILQKYAAADNRIHVYKNEVNLGFKKNFEKAISLCSGEFIALSDQDDIWEKNHLEVLAGMIAHNSLACGNAIMVDADNQPLGQYLNENEKLYFFPSDGKKYMYRGLLTGNCLQGASMLMKSDFVQRVLPFPDKVRYHDVWFALCACFENGIVYNFTPITRYRQHGDNITYHTHTTKNIFFYLIIKFLKIFKAVSVDRFDYCDLLKQTYACYNTDFNNINRIFDHLEKKYLDFKDMSILWRNYAFITTKKSRWKCFGFIVLLIRLLRWRRMSYNE